jgi:hypothetical protein
VKPNAVGEEACEDVHSHEAGSRLTNKKGELKIVAGEHNPDHPLRRFVPE